MHLTRRTGLDNQTGRRAHAGLHQMLMHGRRCEQRRNRHAVCGHRTIRKNEHVHAELDVVHSRSAETCHGGFDAFCAPCCGIRNVQLFRTKRAAGEQLNVANALHVLTGQNRLLRFEARLRLRRVVAQQIRARADEGDERHHQFFTNRIDRRIGHLRKQLAEIVEQRLCLVRQHGQRSVVAHGARGFFAIRDHRRQDDFEVLLRVAKRLLAIQ